MTNLATPKLESSTYYTFSGESTVDVEVDTVVGMLTQFDIASLRKLTDAVDQELGNRPRMGAAGVVHGFTSAEITVDAEIDIDAREVIEAMGITQINKGYFEQSYIIKRPSSVTADMRLAELLDEVGETMKKEFNHNL